MVDAGQDRFIENGKGLLIFDSEEAYRKSQIKKFNHNHDPKTGQFTTGSGSEQSRDKSYQIRHRPPTRQDVENEEACLAHDIEMMMPGFYENPHQYKSYTEGNADNESIEQIRRIHGNPEADVTVYRGSPKKELNDGDWVSLSRSYAEMYAGDGVYAGEGSSVYSYNVKAKDLTFDGNSINEFGFRPADGVEKSSILKYNHNHDHETGQFTTGSGDGSGSNGTGGNSRACILAEVKKGEPMSHDEADSGNVNPKFDPNSTEMDYRYNCYLCVLAYEARRRGYNVEAEAHMGIHPLLNQSDTNQWRNPDGSPVRVDHTVDIAENDANPADTCYNELMMNMKSDGRYHFSFGWADGRGSHVVCMSKPSGIMQIYDPQSNTTHRGMNECKAYLSRVNYPRGKTRLRKPSIIRVDNKEFNTANVMFEGYIFREKL